VEAQHAFPKVFQRKGQIAWTGGLQEEFREKSNIFISLLHGIAAGQFRTGD
jgi:hypothetical protein